MLNEEFRFHVHARGGIVEDEEPRVTRKGPRHRQTLPLPAGQGDAALSHPGVVAIRKLHNEVVSARRFGSRHDGVEVEIITPVGDVVPNGGGE